jgi:hypothetical protein
MSSKYLCIRGKKLKLSNPNPLQCWLPTHQNVAHGEFSFVVITQIEIERCYLVKPKSYHMFYKRQIVGCTKTNSLIQQKELFFVHEKKH